MLPIWKKHFLQQSVIQRMRSIGGGGWRIRSVNLPCTGWVTLIIEIACVRQHIKLIKLINNLNSPPPPQLDPIRLLQTSFCKPQKAYYRFPLHVPDNSLCETTCRQLLNYFFLITTPEAKTISIFNNIDV